MSVCKLCLVFAALVTAFVAVQGYGQDNGVQGYGQDNGVQGYGQDNGLDFKGPLEKVNLKKFMDRVTRSRIIPFYSPVRKFARDELYMLRWLRGFNQYLDVDVAYRNFKAHLDWRKREKIDKIVEEDWADMEQDFPLFHDGYDKQGRPVAEMWTSIWGTHQPLNATMRHRLFRWIMRSFEIQTRRLYDARREGVNITEVVLLMDQDVYDRKVKCEFCLREYVNVGYALAKNYPLTVGYVYVSGVDPSRLDDLIIPGVNPFDQRLGSRKVDLANFFQSFKTVTLQKQGGKQWQKDVPTSEEIKENWPILLDERIEVDQRSAYFGGEIPREQDSHWYDLPT